jgi:hypothetical protein
MLTRTRNRIFIAALALLLGGSIVYAQNTAFTYQGKLSNSANPANGSYDMQFKVFDALTDGAQQGVPVTHPTVQVTAGAFIVELDFGAEVFDGAPRFLEICVRPAGSPDPYTVLAPRQSITATPYAMHSMKSAAADGLTAACVNCVTGGQVESIDGAQITGVVSGSQISGAIPIESVPTGSNNYIQNAAVALRAGRPAATQEGDIDVTGFGKFGGDLIVDGNAGIGLSAPPTNKLQVLSSAVGVPAIYGESATSRGVWGKSVGSRGVYGESTNGEGVFGISTSASGVYGESAAVNTILFSGVAGRATGSGGAAVVGLATGSGAFGVYGESATGRAVYGKSVGSRGVYGESTNGEGVFGISTNASGVHGIANNASGVGGYFQNNSGGGTALLVDGSGKILFSGTGFVGIGTINPTTPLHIEGSGGIAATIKSINERAILALDSSPAGQRRVWTLESGFSGTPGLFAIFDQTADRARLTIDAAGTVGVKVLEIQGGGDFSENFDVREAGGPKAGLVSTEVERGLLVSIDQENPGKLVVSRRAYDRRVAGIISGAGGISPGLVMGQKGSIADGKHPVAMTGRVWAYCDARRNPINPGDLLTTSATPGHAMRVRNYDKAQGAIIGKAMTGLKGGRGLVLVLVSLQ